MNRLRLGTRKSPLAQIQARWVAARLNAEYPDLDVEIVLMSTSGDMAAPGSRLQAQGKAVASSLEPRATSQPGGLKALFTKEIEDALLSRHIDVAVHSLKDMASEIPKGLLLAAVSPREEARDAWISQRNVPLKNLPLGARVATGAVRRQAQLRHFRPDLKLLPMRGNVDTRLRKLEEGDYDGLVLAYAGLKRLGFERMATEILSVEVMLPAVGQGALAIETRDDDKRTLKLIKNIDDPLSHQAALAERSFLKTLGGSCQTPIAAYAHIADHRLMITGLVVGPSGDPYLRSADEGSSAQAEKIGERLARTLLARGADKILTA